jgi:hypothetical protein
VGELDIRIPAQLAEGGRAFDGLVADGIQLSEEGDTADF